MVRKKKTDCVAVLTADIIHSTRYAKAERQRIDRVLTKAFTEVNRVYPRALQTKPAFRVTAGDEFQCVFADVPESFNTLTYLRCVCATSGLKPPLTFRASIGVGSMSVSGKTSPYEEDGKAFVRSRRGLEQDRDRARLAGSPRQRRIHAASRGDRTGGCGGRPTAVAGSHGPPGPGRDAASPAATRGTPDRT